MKFNQKRIKMGHNWKIYLTNNLKILSNNSYFFYEIGDIIFYLMLLSFLSHTFFT